MALYEITSQDLPLDFESTMESDMLERTIRNAKNLLMCRRGEIPFDVRRGLDPTILDKPFNDAQALIAAECDRVMLWEPDVEVNSAWLTVDENGETVVHCVVKVLFEED